MTPAAERNVVLTGFMGTGKTTVGLLIARELGWVFVDTDHLIIERHGSIDQIFAQQGEGTFRELERQIAAEVAAGRRQVIATGGRMLLDAANADALSATGRVFCLTADADEIVRRLQSDTAGPARPLLADDDPAAAVSRLLAERSAGYEQFEQVPTGGRQPDDIAADIIHRLEA